MKVQASGLLVEGVSRAGHTFLFFAGLTNKKAGTSMDAPA